MVGFGAAITDASAILIQRLPPARRAALIAELFGHGRGGLGLDFTRLTIGASDFSPVHYSFDDMPAGAHDPALARFSIAPNRADVLPTVKAALAANPRLTVMASPWSPPGWMKTSDSMIGGTLRPDAYEPYARYFVRYLGAYAAEGVPIRYVTIQNEPDFSPKDYPGMKWAPADRARFVGRHLGPALEQAGLATRVLEWDHNWDQPEQPETVLADAAAARFIPGVAWHCYGGEVAAQARVRARFPDKDVFFTECSGGGWRPGWKAGFGDMVRNLMIGSTANWARGVLLWNLALDPAGGPHKGGCGNCRGVVTIDPARGPVTRELEYYALGHLSRFVRPGAVRIAAESAAGLPAVAFRNPDRSTVLLVYNDRATAAPVVVRAGARAFRFDLPPAAARTVRWR
jgi:glucosylceramidase